MRSRELAALAVAVGLVLLYRNRKRVAAVVARKKHFSSYAAHEEPVRSYTPYTGTIPGEPQS